jgi:tagatose-1,6-bisphosphate aldolase
MRCPISRSIVVGFAFLTIIFTDCSAGAEEESLDAKVLETKRLPAVVYGAMHTQLPGTAVLKVKLPFPGNASFASAICTYRESKSQMPRILLSCTKIYPQGYQPIEVVSEFFDNDGVSGVLAQRAPNGDLFTGHGGQTGYLEVERVLGIAR